MGVSKDCFEVILESIAIVVIFLSHYGVHGCFFIDRFKDRPCGVDAPCHS